MGKQTDIATVISQERLAPSIYSMWLETKVAKDARPGQFISVYSKDASKLLPRPISICEIDSNGKLRIVYRVVGKGTDEFSTYKAGDTVKIMGPVGNGFNLSVKEDTVALLIGGGIGIPPMLGLAEGLKCKKILVAGYRSNKELFLQDEIKENAELYVATDDGSYGTNGTVIDCIRENNIKADVIFACGPKPMLRGVKALGEEWNVPTYVSMEERMACGVGACLGCVCKTTGVDDHSKVNNKRVCVDGPVFLAGEVEL